MRPQLYQRVALRRDVPDHNLRKSDVAVLVDRVPHPKGRQRGCVLEVFNALDDSVAVVVPETDVEPLRADDRLSVRRLVSARG